MRIPASMRVAWMAATLMPVLAVSGCGSTKKEPTVAERLAAARKEADRNRSAAKLSAALAAARKEADPKRGAAMLAVARAQIAKGDPVGARDTITEVHDQAIGRGEAGVTTLLDVARMYVALEDPRSARKTLAEATAIVKKIEDPDRNAFKAKIMADAGALFGNEENGLADREQAGDLLAEATELAEGVEDRFRAEALAVVAMGYVGGGMAEQAAKMVDKLEECMSALDEPRAKAEALAAAASVYASTKDMDKSASFLKEAAAVAEGIERADGKAYALLAVANAEYAAGNTEAAVALLKKADVAVGKVADPDIRDTAMNTIRTAMARMEK